MPDLPYAGPLPLNRNLRRPMIAAAVAALVFLPVAVYFLLPDKTPEEAVAEQTFRVDDGVKGSVILPDSTQVQLNSGSSIRLCDGFGTSSRKVFLDGEAYFKVKADNDHPFFITTDKDVTVKVTGTEFNLSCYSTQEDVRLSLVRGSVDIIHNQKLLCKVSPGEEVSVADGKVSMETAADASYAWTSGNLVFDNTPMREVMDRLSRWYGVEICVTDESLYRGALTADFKSESIQQVLELLRITSGMDYQYIDNRVTFSRLNH